MFYDKKYQDNVILRREAFQNLLTNIKNYPIIDVDFVEEFETDHLHDNNIWRDYTQNTPCLKITYGDESTNKGNSMFATTTQKRRLFNNQKILKKLQIELNNKNYEEKKLRIAYQNNLNFLRQEEEQLNRIIKQMDIISKNKEAFLQAGLSIFYFPYSDDSTNYKSFEDLRDTNGGPLSTTGINFGYTSFPVNITENSETKTITLKYSTLAGVSLILSRLNALKEIKDANNIYIFSEDEQNVVDSFKNFMITYNFLTLSDSLKAIGFNDDEILQFQSETNQFHRLSDESYALIHQKFNEILSNANLNWEQASQTDFQSLVNVYKQNIAQITRKIIGDENNEGIIANNMATIQKRLNELRAIDYEKEYAPADVTNNTYIPNFYYLLENEEYILDKPTDDDNQYGGYDSSKIYYEVTNGSIPYYTDQINHIKANIENLNADIINTSHQKDKTVYGYKYIKLGTNIHFAHNFGGYSDIKISEQQLNSETLVEAFQNTRKQDQASGTFQIDINNEIYEVPIKGFNGESSNKDIHIKTETITENGSELGNINFLGNIFGKGSIVTNTGHIYASQGSVAAAGFLAMRSSVGTIESTCGFRYNGGKKVIETYDITGNTIKEYSTNMNDYEYISELPSVDDGQIYIHSSHVNVNEQTIDSADENRLTWQEAIEYETDNGATDWYCTSVKSSAPFTKLSTQQIYLSNGNKFATLKVNSSDNNIEIYNADSDYNDGGLTGLKAASTNIIGNLTVSNTIRANNLYLNNNNVTSNIPSTNGTSEQFWIGGIPHWGNTLTGDLILSNAAGADENIIPDNSEATDEGGAVFRCAGAGYFGLNLSAKKVFNAVYNDYAEYRQTINLEPGRVVIDNDDGSLSCASERLQPGAQVISDTFGHAMGFADNYQTPLAVAGRVLVYTYQDRSKYHAGMAVCSAPNGTVDIMSREEIKEYSDCIIGIVSEIPKYDTWGSDNIKVNGRIWIKIK